MLNKSGKICHEAGFEEGEGGVVTKMFPGQGEARGNERPLVGEKETLELTIQGSNRGRPEAGNEGKEIKVVNGSEGFESQYKELVLDTGVHWKLVEEHQGGVIRETESSEQK